MICLIYKSYFINLLFDSLFPRITFKNKSIWGSYMTEQAKKIIRKHALLNAFRYGKAEPGKIIGKVLGEEPDLKNDMDSLKSWIGDAVVEVNKLSEEQIKKELEENSPDMLEKKEETKKDLPDLKEISRQVVMRFEPSPSGPLHIGHAYVLGLIAEYARRYKAKLILRLADTNPANIDTISYDQIPKDAEWLTDGGVSEVIVQSDNLETYYQHARDMIEKGHAYICTCSAEEFRELAQRKEECSCRGNTSEKNAELWKMMSTKFKEGEAVMRFKTDMKHKNPAMRDFPLMRINDDEHPRQGKKYRVWPLMNFSVAVDDYEQGMTHILRAKDHADNAKRQEYIQHAMGWPVPQTQFVGRINFLDLEVSCSKTRARIDKGEFDNWDDIRLPFLMAMKRRGFQPGAFIRYSLSVGVSLSDKKVSNDEFFKALYAFNKDMIDPVSNRYFFVDQPVEVVIEGAPEQDIELDLHPDNKKGGRIFNADDRFFLAKSDLDSIKEGELVRLMDCFNIRKKEEKLLFDSLDYEKYKGNGKKIIHWLPAGKRDDLFEVEVIMPDNSRVTGLGEEAMKKLKTGDIVQLERFGFCRLDEEQGNRLIFWFAHK
ncbi:glutamate--tRNA ligase [Candidatus Woesearchaeota archaeon]|nr:glutamate--tRNA ligase [Candidatus Woesearchaeota archaeon]